MLKKTVLVMHSSFPASTDAQPRKGHSSLVHLTQRSTNYHSYTTGISHDIAASLNKASCFAFAAISVRL